MHNRIIKNYVETELAKGIHTRFELNRAYKTLEIDHPEQIDEDGINAVFHSRCIEAPHREVDFKYALDVISWFNNNGKNKENGSFSTGEKKGRFPLRLMI